MTPFSLVWLGRHWGGCECPCLSVSPCGGSFCSGMGQLGTPFQGWGRTDWRHQFRDGTAWGHRFRHNLLQGWQGEAGLSAQALGVLREGVSVPTPCQPPTCSSGAARSCLPGRACQEFGKAGGARLPPCPLTPRMIQALFCFSSSRRRGQPDGWRWLPRRDKTARLSRHNRSVRLLARPGGHGPGAGWVLACPWLPRVLRVLAEG